MPSTGELWKLRGHWLQDAAGNLSKILKLIYFVKRSKEGEITSPPSSSGLSTPDMYDLQLLDTVSINWPSNIKRFGISRQTAISPCFPSVPTTTTTQYSWIPPIQHREKEGWWLAGQWVLGCPSHWDSFLWVLLAWQLILQPSWELVFESTIPASATVLARAKAASIQYTISSSSMHCLI